VTEVLFSQAFHFQDFDALYNDQLFNIPDSVQNFSGSGWAEFSGFRPPKDNHTYQFRNGTSRTINNTAVPGQIIQAQSGQELFEKYIAPSPNTSAPAIAQSSSASASGSVTTSQSSPSATASQSVSPSATAAARLTNAGFPQPLFWSTDNSSKSVKPSCVPLLTA
jgi:hypothetical protein